MTTQLFPEPPSASAPLISRGFAVYSADNEMERSPAVRHLSGYAAFVSMCTASGADPASLATDLRTLAAFIREKKNEMQSNGVQDAAAIFLGNVLVQQRDDAIWMQYGDDFPSAGTNQQRNEVVALLRSLAESDEAIYATCIEKMTEWIKH